MMNILFLCDYTKPSATNTCVWTITQEAVARGYHCVICSFQGCVFDSSVDKNPHFGVTPQEKVQNPFFMRIKSYLLGYRTLGVIKHSKKCNLLRDVVKEKIQDFMPDVVVSSLNPIESVIIGQEIKRKYLGKVKFVPYFLDAIYACKPLTGMPKWLYRLLGLYREKILLKEADAVVMMHSAECMYQNSNIRPAYFSKITFLDIPFYIPVPPASVIERKYFPKGQKVLFYAGTMSRNIRDPRFFLQVFSMILDDSLHVYFAGSSGFMSEMEEYAEKDKRIHFLGMIPHEEVIARVCEADYMLNLGNHFKGMMPSKIFEYISARKPIISTYFIDNDICNEYLESYKAAIMLDEREEIASAIEKLDMFLKTPPTVPEYIVLNQLFNNNKPATLVDFLEDLDNDC